MIVVFVEGDSDAGFIKGVCEKLGIACRVYVLRGNRVEKASRKARTVAEKSQLTLLLKDTHSLAEDMLQRFEKEVYGSLRDLEKRGVRIKVLRVVRSIESWILAGLCEQKAESIEDPVGRLRDKLGRDIIKSEEFYKKLAEGMDVQHAARNSHSFEEFLENLGVK